MKAENDLVSSVSAQKQPEQTKMKIGLLIQLYVSHSEPFVAEAVAK